MRSLLRKAAPPELNGLTAELTSCRPSSRLTVSSIATAYLDSVSLPPFGASSTSGLLPYACSGRLSSSSSVALVESVPGRVRLSFVLLPEAWPIATNATAATTQTPIIGQWWREQKRPIA